MAPIIDDDYAAGVCKMKDGVQCCRYLMMTTEGFECAKHPENLAYRKRIDMRQNQMVASGDNCDGYDRRLEDRDTTPD